MEGEAYFFLFLSFPLQRMQRDRENEGELLQPKGEKTHSLSLSHTHTNTNLSIFFRVNITFLLLSPNSIIISQKNHGPPQQPGGFFKADRAEEISTEKERNPTSPEALCHAAQDFLGDEPQTAAADRRTWHQTVGSNMHRADYLLR